jgi:hypothetical protein
MERGGCGVSGDGPKVVDIGIPDEFRAAIDQFRRKLPEMLEHAQLQAKVRRASYLAYVAEGFTEAQALELCKS